jgi:hypothetical protein
MKILEAQLLLIFLAWSINSKTYRIEKILTGGFIFEINKTRLNEK